MVNSLSMLLIVRVGSTASHSCRIDVIISRQYVDKDPVITSAERSLLETTTSV